MAKNTNPPGKVNPEIPVDLETYRRHLLRARDAGNYFIFSRLYVLSGLMTREEALFYQDLINIAGMGCDVKGWFRCTDARLEKSLAWNKDSSKKWFKRLKQRGFIEIEKRGVPPHRYVRLNIEFIEKALDKSIEENPPKPSKTNGNNDNEGEIHPTDAHSSPFNWCDFSPIERCESSPIDSCEFSPNNIKEENTGVFSSLTQIQKEPKTQCRGAALPPPRQSDEQKTNEQKDSNTFIKMGDISVLDNHTSKNQVNNNTIKIGYGAPSPKKQKKQTSPFPSIGRGCAPPSLEKNIDTCRAELLYSALQKKGLVKPNKTNLRSWSKELALLRDTDGYENDAIDDVLTKYISIIGMPFVPEAFCGKSFREKFLRIKRRVENTPEEDKPQEISPEALEVLKYLAHLDWPKGSDAQLPLAVQKSLMAYKAFKATVKAIGKQDTDLASFARFLASGHLPAPEEFVTSWFEYVNHQVIHWKGWSGKLKSWTYDHPEYTKIGVDIAIEWDHKPKDWHNLIAMVETNFP